MCALKKPPELHALCCYDNRVDQFSQFLSSKLASYLRRVHFRLTQPLLVLSWSNTQLESRVWPIYLVEPHWGNATRTWRHFKDFWDASRPQDSSMVHQRSQIWLHMNKRILKMASLQHDLLTSSLSFSLGLSLFTPAYWPLTPLTHTVYFCTFGIACCVMYVSFVVLCPSTHQQEGSLHVWARSCSRVLPVLGSLSCLCCCLGVRLWRQTEL